MTGKLFSLRGKERKTGSSSHLYIDKATGRLWLVSKKMILGNFSIHSFYDKTFRIKSINIVTGEQIDSYIISQPYVTYWNYEVLTDLDYIYTFITPYREDFTVIKKYAKDDVSSPITSRTIDNFELIGVDLIGGKIFLSGGGEIDDNDILKLKSYSCSDLSVINSYDDTSVPFRAYAQSIGADTNHVYTMEFRRAEGEPIIVKLYKRTHAFSFVSSLTIPVNHLINVTADTDVIWSRYYDYDVGKTYVQKRSKATLGVLWQSNEYRGFWGLEYLVVSKDHVLYKSRDPYSCICKMDKSTGDSEILMGTGNKLTHTLWNGNYLDL